MFVLRKVRPYQRAHKFYLLFFMSWHSTGMQPPNASAPAPALVPAPAPVPDASVGNGSSVANIFKTLHSRPSTTHTHTPTHTKMSSLCFNEMCVACVRSRNASGRGWGQQYSTGGMGAACQRCCCHLKNCAQKYATLCRAFQINTIYAPRLRRVFIFYSLLFFYLFASSFLS